MWLPVFIQASFYVYFVVLLRFYSRRRVHFFPKATCLPTIVGKNCMKKLIVGRRDCAHVSYIMPFVHNVPSLSPRDTFNRFFSKLQRSNLIWKNGKN